MNDVNQLKSNEVDLVCMDVCDSKGFQNHPTSFEDTLNIGEMIEELKKIANFAGGMNVKIYLASKKYDELTYHCINYDDISIIHNYNRFKKGE